MLPAPSVGISLSSRAAAARTYFTLPGAVPAWSFRGSDLVCAAGAAGGRVCADFVRDFLAGVQTVRRSAQGCTHCKSSRISVRLRRMAAAPRDRGVSGRKRPGWSVWCPAARLSVAAQRSVPCDLVVCVPAKTESEKGALVHGEVAALCMNVHLGDVAFGHEGAGGRLIDDRTGLRHAKRTGCHRAASRSGRAQPTDDNESSSVRQLCFAEAVDARLAVTPSSQANRERTASPRAEHATPRATLPPAYNSRPRTHPAAKPQDHRSDVRVGTRKCPTACGSFPVESATGRCTIRVH